MKWLRLVVLLVSTLVGSSAQAADPTSGLLDLAAPGSYALPILGEAGDGEVVLEQGRPEQLKHLFHGHIVLLNFIYTRCVDAQGCPLASSILRQTLQRIDRAIRLRVLTISFDPEHDTPAVMHTYGEQFRQAGDQRWAFLTPANQASLASMLKRYGQQVEADPPKAGTAGYSHLLRMFLIDRDGKIRNIYGAGLMTPELLVNDVLTLAKSGAQPAISSNGPRTGQQKAIDLYQLTKQQALGFPSLPLPENEYLTKTRIALGRKLFFDRRLSGNGTLACSNCHVPNQAFANNEMATAVGVEGRTVRRNAPTLIDIAYAKRLFHDGRETMLETQVWSPLLAQNEMAAPSVGWVVAKLRRLPDYRKLFEQAYGQPAGMETIGRALASYERALLGGASPFDRWHYGGDQKAVSSQVQRGFKLFTGKAGCASCHSLQARHALFTDNVFHVSGLAWKKSMQPNTEVHDVPLAPGVQTDLSAATMQAFANAPGNDLGRYEISFDPKDRWAFRTPSLRNVALTAPYMHDGSLPNLAAVVAYYNAGGIAEAPQDPRIVPLQLTVDEQAELIAFLESLTGDKVAALAADGTRAPIGDPNGGELD